MKRLGLLTVLALLAFPAFSQILGEPIVHWDFADGIPEDFVNTGPGPDAAWEYRGPETTPDLSVGSQGSCSGSFGPIESESADNGFVLFDSAFWDDNDGNCDGGGGLYEGPHEAILETPGIDLSLNENLILTWQQFVRHYECTTTVSISIDGGMSWDELHDNGGWFIIGDTDEWVSYNITETAAGQSDVRFRFRFFGDHYWWMLDDIAVYEPNENDLMLASSTYTLFDFNQDPDGYGDIAYSIYPEIMLSPLNVTSRIQNIGGQVQTGVTLNVNITRDGSEVLSDDDGPTDLAPSASSTFGIAPWVPPGAGDYEINYEAVQDQVDENTSNNTSIETFRVHPYEYGRDDGMNEGQYLGISLYYDAEFFMGNMFESREDDLVIHSIGFALGDSTTVGTQVTGRVVNRDSTDVILAETAPYTVNLWDLNSEGEGKFVWLPLTEPLITVDSALYFAGVHHPGSADERARVALSGLPPIETTILSYPATNSLFYMAGTPMVRLGLFNAGQSPGCTDDTAVNFDSEADTDDGTCRFPGCTIAEAENYDPAANQDDGSCIIAGCTDPEADNYDENASEDDGSCQYLGCTNPDAENYDPQANTDDGSCIVNGCTDPEADNFDPEATIEDGTCLYLGCTDPEADNYDETANEDDGSCQYLGCIDPNALNFDPEANTDDGSCQYAVAFFMLSDTVGCAPLTVTVSNLTLTNEDGSCAWDFDDGNTSEDCFETLDYTYTDPGTYFLTYTYTISDVITEFTLEVTVYATPAAPVISFDEGTSIMSCDNCSDGLELQWYIDGSTIPEENTSWEVTTNGPIYLQVTNEDGCSAESNTITVISIGIEEQGLAQWNAWPNPASNALHVQTTLAEGALLIRDLRGRVVHPGELATGRYQFLDVGELSDGIYLLEWRHDGQCVQKRIAIRR